jgi:hypothetical protein
MFSESWRAMCCRLLDREKNTPTIRKERQMMVMEKKFRARYCQRLFRATFRK